MDLATPGLVGSSPARFLIHIDCKCIKNPVQMICAFSYLTKLSASDAEKNN